MNDSSTSSVLIMTAVEAERQAVLRGLNGDDRFDVVIAGVGAPSAAARTAAAIAARPEAYRCVISAGIGGGFAGRAALGEIVIADTIIAADLGAETPDGFASVDELGFGSSRIEAAPALSQRWAAALQAAGLPARYGPVLTVNTATGTAATAEALAARYPGAAAEAMEGYGAAVAAQAQQIPALEIRTISNAVGPRDRAAWRIPEALQQLQAAVSILPEVL
ncbi:futalosine hydrolase [Paenibacillus sp. JX-17]|uniref:Futalosine hydrolase n=1 Tax=Paenibacillus lacisoli TaxID=3064525 RepID=A0ABT9CCR5_9BACL|nr:futalosine hydrolase [Paenibacillus sp. JX-17]MDO7907056.1 futalosine hydrolase [Paenibacillus sp. JX-17]